MCFSSVFEYVIYSRYFQNEDRSHEKNMAIVDAQKRKGKTPTPLNQDIYSGKPNNPH